MLDSTVLKEPDEQKNIPLILSPEAASLFDEAHIGGKAYNMAWLSRNDVTVPEWFVITTRAFLEHLSQEKLDQWIKAKPSKFINDTAKIKDLSAKIKKSLSDSNLQPSFQKALQEKLQSIANWQDNFFAVRSSAIGEDSLNASFAGQMDSFLFQKGLDQILQSIKKVFASTFNERVLYYRMRHGCDPLAGKVAIVVQKMVNSRVSGVFFSANPTNGNRKQGLISACYGSGEGIVSGACNTDEFTVDLYSDEFKSEINEKDKQILFDQNEASGTRQVPVPDELRNQPCLNPEEIKKIKDTGTKIAELAQYPQDIEWTLTGDELYILQTRPITNLPAPAEPAGQIIVWDNSNIQESYCGVTTPLTFSFASRGYRSVYKQTYELMGVPNKTIKQMEPVFKNLLGIIRGRIYYNINNWYRALLILPSFKTNKADMERMMGLQDPVDFVEDQKLSLFQKTKRIPALFKALYNFKSGFRNIETLVAEFKEMFQREYNRVNRSRLHTLEMSELLDLLNILKKNMIGNWQTPIINDFYVMMMNGRVHRWLEKAGLDNPEILQNNLMCGEQGIESTEPTKYLLNMCDYVRRHVDLKKLIENTPTDKLLNAVQESDKIFFKQCLDYIELYGDRCMGELKLESISLRKDPSFMFAVLKNYLDREELSVDTLKETELRIRHQAEKETFHEVSKSLGERKLKKFKKDLSKLRQGVKNRENMRLARTRAFGLARDIYLELGNQLALYDVLQAPRDIFYLSEEELEAYMEGRSVQADFKTLVSGRKAEFRAYQDMELPHHFSTKGPVYHHNRYVYEAGVPGQNSNEILSGTGCYPGVVEGRVRLIFSPQDELQLNGQILCTVRTDPGWAPLFPSAGGLLVERGSTLSHSAVVARELGIPAIVNIPGLTRTLTDGEHVRIDGNKGTIERLKQPA